jgi:hypothetical protein
MQAQDYRLSLMHYRLETEIGREQARALPDRWRLIRLKKLKLAIKDRLHRLAQHGGGAPA